MMEKVFLYLLNTSITAAWITLAVIILRLILSKAPKWIRGILWSFVALRLICPFSFESIFSLIPSSETVPQEILFADAPAIDSGFHFINHAVNPVISGVLSPATDESINPMQLVTFTAAILWIAGMAVMLCYAAISYGRIRKTVGEAIKTYDNIWICDNIPTPFILGVLHPKIYLPSSVNEADRECVVCHEKAHIKRKDHLWKPLGFLLLTIYWFNPVLWIAYVLLCRDIELACDERVIRQMGTEIKKPYVQALINCSAPRRMVAVCPLAFGETGVKERVKSVLNYRKPAFWIIVVTTAACITAAVCLLTTPVVCQLQDIEQLSTSKAFGETVQVYLTSDGETYQINSSFDRDALRKLGNVSIRPNGVFSLSEDRNKTNTIVLQNSDDAKPTFGSSLEGIFICFNHDFTQVWVSNGVKTTHTYTVLNSNNARELFQALQPDKDSSPIPDAGEVDDSSDASTHAGSNPYFNATVLEVHEGSVLVEPFEGTNERKSSDKISVSLHILSTNPVPELKKGATIRVVYNGEIAETYPAQIGKVFAIYALDANGQVIYTQPSP